MSRDPDWSDLAGAWTENGEDAARGSDAQLVRRLRRRAVAGRINFIFECLLCGGALAVALWLVLSGGPVRLTIGAATVAFAGFGLATAVWARGRSGPTLTGTPADAVRTALHQAESGLRWARAGWWMTLAAFGFLAVHLAVDLLDRGPGPLTLPLIGGGAVALAGWGAFYRWHARRCRRRIAHHRVALDELEG